MQPPARTSLRRRLLAWFTRHARALPWRTSRDPYAIWISEVMLQQTQVVTVIPFFERFLKAFPNIAALAQADEQQVLRLWEGLGYYRRARDLHRAARLLASRHGGAIPNDADVLRALPGLGRYTVNAVLSQAFDARLPIVEANSIRVLCRLLGITDDPTKGSVRNRLWDAAAVLLPRRQVGQFNQALMELGALICTPDPKCAVCPLAGPCAARQQGMQDKIPMRPRGKAPTRVREVAIVVRCGSRVLLAQRPARGRWANLWEFPHTPIVNGETDFQAAARLLAHAGIEAKLGEEISTIRHTVTRFHITLKCMTARYRRGHFKSTGYANARWLRPAEIADMPVSSPQRRLVGMVSAREGA